MDEAAFRELISGKKRGAVATLLRTALRGLSPCYSSAIRLRNGAYNHGWKRIHQVAVPIISVGNITTGGTGKTPFVAYLANWFREKNVRVGLLSRGYRSLPGEVNDEKLVLDQLCPNIPHIQNPNRVEAARIACQQHDCELLILDDGFQHRRLSRDLDIVLIDALNPWGYGHLLPRGLLREPLSSLQRADIIVLTRADQCSTEQRQQITKVVQQHSSIDEMVEAAFRPHRLINANGELMPLDFLKDKRGLAFCGIGNPDSFRETLKATGMQVDSLHPFPDHHHYTHDELNVLGKEAKQKEAAVILTTQKDLVKIEATSLGQCPLWAVEIGTEILSGRDQLEKKLDCILPT